MNSKSIQERVRTALTRVCAADGRDVFVAGTVRELEVESDGRVRLRLNLDRGDTSGLADTLRYVTSGVEGVTGVQMDLAGGSGGAGGGAGEEGAAGQATAGGDSDDPGEVAGDPEDAAPTGPRRAKEAGRRRSLPVMSPGGAPGAMREGRAPRSRPVPGGEASRRPAEAEPLEGVRRVIAVSSGKGGVGKSTVSTNLAVELALRGHRVGLLDADIYGPDIPTMFGVSDKPRMEDDMVLPIEAHGVRLMSLGLLVDEDTPAIWRGPIVMGIMRQFLRQVRWGELDYLIVDLPPGTGDAQLSLVQLVKVSGAVMVTTPQDVAVGGVLKGIRMFETVDIPVIGVVENMRGFVCPDSGKTYDIFGSGGGERMAASLSLPFLGAVPLGMAVREEGDRGQPTVVGRPDSPEAEALRQIVTSVESRMEVLEAEASEAEASEASKVSEPPPPTPGAREGS